MSVAVPAKPQTPVLIAVPRRRFDPEHAERDMPDHLKQLLGVLAGRATQSGFPWQFEMMLFGGGNVARGRNKIVAQFLRGSWRWIVFIDDDIHDESPAAMADAVIRILSHRKHICGALYTTKEEDAHWVLNSYREPEIDKDGLLPVPELGTGGLKTFHRSVFETLIEKEPDLDYSCDDTAAPEWGFFCQGLMVVDGRRRWLPEDYWCDQLCRRHGIPVFVDTTIKLRHLDTDGVSYPIDDDWPRLPGPMSPITPPQTAEDMPPRFMAGKFIIALQYWAGDRAAAMRLARFIADNEPGFRHDVVLRFVWRHDSSPPDEATVGYVSQKMFVSDHPSPIHKPGYPVSPNTMALDVMHSAARWEGDAILLMEADCVPVAKDWINQLRDEWGRAHAAGALLLGSWRPECSMRGHINGNLIFHPEMAKVAKLPIRPPKKAWDVVFVHKFYPHWMRTGLIANRYQEMFVTPAKLATPECGSRPPVLVHGIKDESAWKVALKLLA